MEKIPKKNFKIRVFSLLLIFTVFLAQIPAVITTYASDTMSGYVNPEDIIISAPVDNYSTTASKISILGACDYQYPLYMNGELIETTEYGFFSVYVELEVGKNYFEFENNGITNTLTITRKKTSSSGTSSGGNSTTPKVTYKEYTTDTYGVISSSYTMPRTTIGASDVSLMPITKGTAMRILGEDGSYYKIVDGTYVSKSSVTKYTKTLNNNKVTKAAVSDNTTNNVLVSKLTMNVNAMYTVTFEDNKVNLTLYDTVSAKKPTLASNDTIKSVTVSVNKTNKTATYTYSLYDGASIRGYDVFFQNGMMIFEIKKAPHLYSEGSLVGATVYLDAGHGDKDNGALGPLYTYGPTEKNINLAITLYAKEYLEDLGATVVLTRSDDTFYELSERVDSIRNVKPDISVSIHGNSIGLTSDYSKASGFLTYYSYDLFQNVPASINASIAKSLGFTEKDPRCSSLSLTRFTTCPSVLLETSFLSNPSDYEYLIKDENQQAFGEAIGSAIQEYLEADAVYENVSVVHTVKKGETLSVIAKKYGVSINAIVKLNNIKDTNHIIVGQKINIPS